MEYAFNLDVETYVEVGTSTRRRLYFSCCLQEGASRTARAYERRSGVGNVNVVWPEPAFGDRSCSGLQYSWPPFFLALLLLRCRLLIRTRDRCWTLTGLWSSGSAKFSSNSRGNSMQTNASAHHKRSGYRTRVGLDARLAQLGAKPSAFTSPSQSWGCISGPIFPRPGGKEAPSRLLQTGLVGEVRDG